MVTGVMDHLGREQVEDLVMKHGGKVSERERERDRLNSVIYLGSHEIWLEGE